MLGICIGRSKRTILKLIVVSCIFATTAVFAQFSVLTWIGPDAASMAGANLGHSTNWAGTNGAGGTSPTSGVICTFDGTVPGNLRVFSQDGIDGDSGNPIGGGFGSAGIAIDLTPSQTGSVTVFSPVPASANMGFNAFRVQGGAGQLILGDNTSNQLRTVFRPGGSFHQWINNSANPVIISPNWMIQGSGAAVGSSIWFQGTGDFCITNNLRSNSGTGNPIPVSWDNTGTTFWAEGFPGGNGTNNSTNLFNTQLGAVTISAGSTLVITTPRLLPLYTYGVSGNTVTHNGTLLKFALSGIGGSSDTIPRVISGTGAVMVVNGTITFTATNTYTGLTTVSNGTLLVNGRLGIGGVNVWGGRLGGSGSILGPVNIGSAGTLSPGNSIGTLTINSNLTIGGNLAIEVGKSPFDPSLLNDHVVVGGGLVNTGVGTLTVSQPSPFGSSLVPGDKFTLFNKPVQNGGALTVTGAGVGWINQLEVDGSIIVSPPFLNYTNMGGTNLQLSWDGNYNLQWQTNSVAVGLSNNWANYPGGSISPVTVPMNGTIGAVFFRLVPTPVPFLRQENP